MVCIWGEVDGEEGELEGSLPNELTVHISNTWSVKPIPCVILLRKKRDSTLPLVSVKIFWQLRSGLRCVAVQEMAAGMDQTQDAQNVCQQ